MKKRNLFAATLIGLALAACSSVEDINGEINQNSEGAVVTLKLDMSNTPLTKGSPGATNEQEGTDAENAISNVTVVVDYGNTTQKVFKSSDDYDTGYGWISDSKTFKFKTPAGDATFYVYANVNGADKDNLSTNWAKDLVSKGTDVSAYYANNSFFMSNQNGKGVPFTINPDATNEVTVNIERAAAKVTVESMADFTDDPHGGTIINNSMFFALGNTVDKFYLLQQDDYSIPTNVAYLDNPIVNWDKSIDVVNSAKTDIKKLPAIYCMENVLTDYKQGKTTYIKFKTTFVPGRILTFADNDTKNGLKVTGDDDFSSKTGVSFYVVLDADNSSLNSSYIKADDIDNSPNVSIQEADEDGKCKVTGIDGINYISKKYENGICYFGPIWVNLDNTGEISPIYRNDWYHLTVNSIKLPGSPTEPVIDEEDKDQPLTPDVNVTVTLSVMKWNLVEHDIDLQ